MSVNKHQAIVEYMLSCPAIQNNPLFFNAIQAHDNSKEIITDATEREMNTPYIDGSVQKRYQFTIIDFRSLSYNPVPKAEGYTSENVQDLLDVQGIIDWVENQRELENYPNFGSDCIIDDITTTSDTPALNGIDTGVTPSLAKYSITIQVDYLDMSKKLFK